MQYKLKINNQTTTLEQGKQYDVEGTSVRQGQGWGSQASRTHCSFTGTLDSYSNGAYGNMLSFTDVTHRSGSDKKEFQIRLEEVVSIAEAGLVGKAK